MPRDELILDGRTAEDLQEQIARLAASYTPEWRFDRVRPDVGGVLALIFAKQMAGNLDRLNQVIGKYHTEFVNLLGVSLRPAYPASGVAVATLVADTVPGLDLPRGTKLVGVGEDETPVIFETIGDVYLTSARLTDVVALSGRFGKIIPLLGGPEPAKFLPLRDERPQPETEEPQLGPISLFDYSAPGIEQNALLLYHKSAFDIVEGAAVRVELSQPDGADGVDFADPEQYSWSYFDGEGLVPYQVERKAAGVALRREGESIPLTLDGEEYQMVCLQPVHSPSQTISVDRVKLASSCGPVRPDFVTHNDRELDPESFQPFGSTASLFDECYIGHQKIFSQAGAMVTLRFKLSFAKRLVDFTPQQEAEELKIIKRKPKVITYQTATTCAQQIALEYFNGIGWRKLVCTQDWSTLFDGEHPGQVEITFRCPEQWQPSPVGGWDCRTLRIRLLRADNCYLHPCIHNMPVMEGLTISYDFQDNWQSPQRLRTVWGTRVEDVTAQAMNGGPIAAFRPLSQSDHALCLGFDGPMEGAPVSILFNVHENNHFEEAPIAFEYSTIGGWKPLRVIDNTDNMAGAGTLVFMPPSDFAPMEVEGVSRWWLRLVDEGRAFDDQSRYHALINAIQINAVEIRNVETLPEEAFYVRSATAGMSYPLAAENILSAEVFVNERDSMSEPAMRQLAAQRPEDVRVSYDFLGSIQSFYVRWTEVENFDQSKPEDRHYVIDRMNNRIVFGDGVHVRIPQAGGGVAFTVQVQCCRGSKGNLPAGAVNSLFDGMLYVDSVSNPIATFAGSDLEHITSAHRRGANIVSGRNRLVSQLDYVREVEAFSDAIEKVKCVAGLDLSGQEVPGQITIAVLMRDYADGAYSFNSIKDRLMDRLLERCEATVTRQELQLTEPVYVEVSVDVWAVADDAHRSFDVQNLIRDSIKAYLDPLGKGDGPGWDIGRLPTEAQMRIMLQSIRGPMHIKRFIITARYLDRWGSHECALDELPSNPFAIAVSGNHRVYVELPQV